MVVDPLVKVNGEPTVGVKVALYPVIAPTPVYVGAVQVTEAVVDPVLETATFVGAPGVVVGQDELSTAFRTCIMFQMPFAFVLVGKLTTYPHKSKSRLMR